MLRWSSWRCSDATSVRILFFQHPHSSYTGAPQQLLEMLMSKPQAIIQFKALSLSKPKHNCSVHQSFAAALKTRRALIEVLWHLGDGAIPLTAWARRARLQQQFHAVPRPSKNATDRHKSHLHWQHYCGSTRSRTPANCDF